MPSDTPTGGTDQSEPDWPDAMNGWEKHEAHFPGVTYLDPIWQEDIPSSRRTIAVRARRGDPGWSVGRSDKVSGDVSHVTAETSEAVKEAVVEWMQDHPCEQRTLATDGGTVENVIDQREDRCRSREKYCSGQGRSRLPRHEAFQHRRRPLRTRIQSGQAGGFREPFLWGCLQVFTNIYRSLRSRGDR